MCMFRNCDNDWLFIFLLQKGGTEKIIYKPKNINSPVKLLRNFDIQILL